MAELTLATTRQRRKIDIDGASYELRDVDELNLFQTAQMRQLEKGFRQFSEDPNISEQALQHISKMVTYAVRVVVVDLPATVLEALTDTQRCQLITVFGAGAKPAPASAPQESQPA